MVKTVAQIGDRMSDKDKKLPSLHLSTKKCFYLAMKKMGLCLCMYPFNNNLNVL